MPPDKHPEYADVLDLTSLDADMVDAFERIEACRKALLSWKNPNTTFSRLANRVE